MLFHVFNRKAAFAQDTLSRIIRIDVFYLFLDEFVTTKHEDEKNCGLVERLAEDVLDHFW